MKSARLKKNYRKFLKIATNKYSNVINGFIKYTLFKYDKFIINVNNNNY